MGTPTYQQYNGAPLGSTPPNLPISAPSNYTPDFENQILNVLRLYFNQLSNFNQSVATPDYGVTSGRPKNGLQTGQIFFDTTLGIPIWWSGTKWVNASGTGV
jgi:hypothetical protein